MTFQFALANGGPASMIYGSILAGLGCCAVGFSLAELASMLVTTSSLILFTVLTSPPEIPPSAHNTAGQPTSRHLENDFGVSSKVPRLAFDRAHFF